MNIQWFYSSLPPQVIVSVLSFWVWFAVDGSPAAPSLFSLFCRNWLAAVGEHKDQRGENNMKYSITEIQKSPPRFSWEEEEVWRDAPVDLHLSFTAAVPGQTVGPAGLFISGPRCSFTVDVWPSETWSRRIIDRGFIQSFSCLLMKSFGLKCETVTGYSKIKNEVIV